MREEEGRREWREEQEDQRELIWTQHTAEIEFFRDNFKSGGIRLQHPAAIKILFLAIQVREMTVVPFVFSKFFSILPLIHFFFLFRVHEIALAANSRARVAPPLQCCRGRGRDGGDTWAASRPRLS